MLPIADVSSEDGKPSLRVYSVPSVVPSRGKTRLRDLSEAGQAALIEAMARPGADTERLRKALAMPLEGGSEADDAIDRTEVPRTLIVTVNKGWNALPGDRLIRTVVTIRPVGNGDKPARFEFTGYTIAATDNKTQDIAKLETESSASLSATLAPQLGGFGDNSVEGEVSRTHKTAADIIQQYEKLNIDIVPDRLVITRESERGLDVVGNTFVEFTLAPIARLSVPQAFLATETELYGVGKPLSPSKAKLSIKPLSYLSACPLTVEADMTYMMRRIVAGREYYTEGKQKVQIVRGSTGPRLYDLVRAQDAQAEMFQIVITKAGEEQSLLARTIDGAQKLLLFDTHEQARQLAYWLQHGGGARVGKEGVELRRGDSALPRGASYMARPYTYKC